MALPTEPSATADEQPINTSPPASSSNPDMNMLQLVSSHSDSQSSHSTTLNDLFIPDGLCFMYCSEDKIGLWASRSMIRDNGAFEALGNGGGCYLWPFTTSDILSEIITYIQSGQLVPTIKPPRAEEDLTTDDLEAVADRRILAYNLVFEWSELTEYVAAVEDQMEQYYHDPEVFYEQFSDLFTRFLICMSPISWFKHSVVNYIITQIQATGLEAFLQTELGNTIYDQSAELDLAWARLTPEDEERLKEVLQAN